MSESSDFSALLSRSGFIISLYETPHPFLHFFITCCFFAFLTFMICNFSVHLPMTFLFFSLLSPAISLIFLFLFFPPFLLALLFTLPSVCHLFSLNWVNHVINCGAIWEKSDIWNIVQQQQNQATLVYGTLQRLFGLCLFMLLNWENTWSNSVYRYICLTAVLPPPLPSFHYPLSEWLYCPLSVCLSHNSASEFILNFVNLLKMEVYLQN